jgi:tRNA pseudouridine55 synthase
VSAIKVDGNRAYTRVREGEEIVLPERAVTIAAFEILAVRRADWVDVDVRVECSSGTYIRALARDLGAELGVGGHLTALRRTRIGPFRVDESSALDDDLPGHLIAPAEAAARLMPTVTLDAAAAAELAQGQRVPLDAAPGPHAALDPDGRLIGLVESVGGRARILMNFPTGEASP